METARARGVFATKRVMCLFWRIRAISDSAGETLNPELLNFVDAHGHSRMGRAAVLCSDAALESAGAAAHWTGIERGIVWFSGSTCRGGRVRLARESDKPSVRRG